MLILQAFFAFLIGAAHAESGPPITAHLAASRSYDTMALARAHGQIEARLAARNITVDWQGPYPAMAPQVEAMAAGALDFGTGSCTSFATARAADAPVTAIGFTAETPGYEGILVPANSPIKSAADLKGRKVAVNKAGTGDYLLLKTLEFYNMPEDSVTRVFMGPADAASAFGLGLVDAWATWDPFVSTAEARLKATMLIPSTAIGTDNMTILTARDGFIYDHPAAAREIFKALLAEDAWAVANPSEAATVWATATKQPIGVATLLASHVGKRMVGVGTAETAILLRAADWMVAHKLIPKTPDITGHVVDLNAGA